MNELVEVETNLPVVVDSPQPSRALADLRQQAMSVPIEVMRTALAAYAEQRMEFREWLLTQMQEGVHFGVAPGCEPRGNVNPKQWKTKPSLYKAGAELIIDLMGTRPEYAFDKEGWEQLGSMAGTFVVCCRLYSASNGKLLGEGRGAFKVGEKKMQENAALKMCEKRAMVDAVLNTWRLSDLFTQDLEEGADKQRHEAPPQRGDAPKAKPRGERRAAVISPQEMGSLIGKWRMKQQLPNPEGDEEKAQQFKTFAAWVKVTTERDFDARKLDQWELDDVLACNEALQFPESELPH